MSLQPFLGHREATANYDACLASLLFDHPDDVVSDDTLSIAEKREILASWASDASAVESVPALRTAPFSRSVVTIDEILAALSKLDGLQR